MGEYADIKRKRILKFLKWLDGQSGFSVDHGGGHQWNVRHISWQRPFPIPFKHNIVNKYIVKELIEKIVETNICTKEEIEERLL